MNAPSPGHSNMFLRELWPNSKSRHTNWAHGNSFLEFWERQKKNRKKREMQNFNETQRMLHPQRANSIYFRFVCFCFVIFAAALCLRFRLFSTLVCRPSVWNRFFPWSRRRVKQTNKFLIKVETKMKWKSIFSWHTAKLSANIFDLLFFLSVEGGFLFDVTITSSSNSSKKEQNKRIELSTKQWKSAPNNHAYNQNGRQR